MLMSPRVSSYGSPSTAQRARKRNGTRGESRRSCGLWRVWPVCSTGASMLAGSLHGGQTSKEGTSATTHAEVGLALTSRWGSGSPRSGRPRHHSQKSPEDLHPALLRPLRRRLDLGVRESAAEPRG